MTEQRRLAAIVSADVAGYSRLMGRDESGTLQALKALRREVVDPRIAAHAGRIVKTTGDGLLLEFPSVVNAVRCAVEVQTAMAARTADVPEDRRIEFRVGLHVGDIIIDSDDIFGDGVNIAARLQEIAAPGGVCVSSRVHDDVRDRLETAFADSGTQTLKNISRPVHVWSWVPRSSSAQPKSSASPADVPLPDKPSIAVLPFQNMSGDPEQEYFVDGLVEDIITALSRFKSLFVIARNSSFTYKGKAVDIKQVGRELGVRYVLEGSVRKTGNRLRITGQLIEAQSGAHLWANRFDGAIEDVFDLQDRVTESLVGAVMPQVTRTEIERARRKPAASLDAYDCVVRGTALLQGSTDAGEEALAVFKRAIELDPGYAAAYGGAALCYQGRISAGRFASRAGDQAEVRRLAALISSLRTDDADALSGIGAALLFVCRDYETGNAMMDQAIELNPNLARAWGWRGLGYLFEGRHEAACEATDRALRLNPIGGANGGAERVRAAALTFLGRHDEAVEWADRALARQPGVAATLRVAAVAHAMAGNTTRAAEIGARLRQIDPAFRVSALSEYLPYRRPEDIAMYVEGLRRAGIPE